MTSENYAASPPRPVRAPDGRPRPDLAQVAAERLGAHRRRMSSIRKRVIATTLVVFALVWVVLFVQLVTGQDPALSKQTAVSSTGTGSTSGTGSASGTGSTSGTSASSGGTSSVTTSQS